MAGEKAKSQPDVLSLAKFCLQVSGTSLLRVGCWCIIVCVMREFGRVWTKKCQTVRFHFHPFTALSHFCSGSWNSFYPVLSQSIQQNVKKLGPWKIWLNQTRRHKGWLDAILTLSNSSQWTSKSTQWVSTFTYWNHFTPRCICTWSSYTFNPSDGLLIARRAFTLNITLHTVCDQQYWARQWMNEPSQPNIIPFNKFFPPRMREEKESMKP